MSGALEKNQRLTLSCARLGSELEGVCSYEGMAVFVPGVLPGETAEVQIVKALPNYAFGRLVQVLEPSAQRAQPRCPVYDKCGGCSGQHMTYEATLEAKRLQVLDCLNRIAGLGAGGGGAVALPQQNRPAGGRELAGAGTGLLSPPQPPDHFHRELSHFHDGAEPHRGRGQDVDEPLPGAALRRGHGQGTFAACGDPF